MFKAGFARVEVTPPLGTELTGYFEKRISDGALDAIELNALAISKNEEKALIITGDFMYTGEKMLSEMRELLEEKVGIGAQNIILQSVHQHTSTSPDSVSAVGREYQEKLKEKYCIVAKKAIEDLAPAKISIAQKETAEPISFVRRFRMKDGSTKTNPGVLNPMIDHPIGNADNTVRLVKFERENEKDIALVGFQTHPDVIGGTKFSADWPGFVRRKTEADIENVHCLLLNGFQGDTNHINVKKNETQDNYKISEKMGRIITDAVIKLWDKTEEVPAGEIKARVVMKYLPTNRNGMERIEECIEIRQKYEKGEVMEEFEMGKYGEIWRISRLAEAPVVQRLPISFISFGKIAIFGLGAEPFTDYADFARAYAPNRFILTACLANGAQDYLPSGAAYSEGGYEARVANFSQEVVDIVKTTTKEFLDELK